MVILVDLDDEPVEAATHLRTFNLTSHHSYDISPDEEPCATDDRPNPNINSFSAALSCYPVVSQLASHLDLNSLHDLSATCRQFRANLLQFRSQLVKQTLRCVNEQVDIGPRLADRMREFRGANGRLVSLNGGGRITSGRVGACARDLVAECRRCGTVVCRNCTIKPPPPKALSERHRRLCRTCIKSPLQTHTSPFPNSTSTSTAAFTAPAFARTPCACTTAVHICLSCGSALRTADTTYMRGWTWRTRYSTSLGGLGTGIGAGNEGVECGRGDACVGAREVEKEIDCEAEEVVFAGGGFSRGEEGDRGTGYFVQEIEGVGGVVKRKVKRRVRVGMVVREYEDERESGEYLARERMGVDRSWCCWCLRVIPGVKDLDGGGEGDLQSSTASSSPASLRSGGRSE